MTERKERGRMSRRACAAVLVVLVGFLALMPVVALGAEYTMGRFADPFILLDSVSASGASNDWQLLFYPNAALSGSEHELRNDGFVDLRLPASEQVRVGMVSDCAECRWEVELRGGGEALDSWEPYASVLNGSSLLISRAKWATASVTLRDNNPILSLAASGISGKFRSVNPDDVGKDRILRVRLVSDASGSTAFRLFVLRMP
jgi:hypothetical protein